MMTLFLYLEILQIGFKFYINRTAGELSFITPPDVNNPTDRNKDNIYRVQGCISDLNFGKE